MWTEIKGWRVNLDRVLGVRPVVRNNGDVGIHVSPAGDVEDIYIRFDTQAEVDEALALLDADLGIGKPL